MSIWNWSRTNATNATADPEINWATGMAPSAISPSARSMMSQISKYRDDTAGSTVTTGISQAYQLNTFSQFTSAAAMSGQLVAFTAHVTNGAGPVTMSLDSVANIPLRSSPGQELQAGVLVQGSSYCAVFNQADNALYLQSFYGNPFNIPLGAGMDYWLLTTPNSAFAFPIGQAISRTTYATLFAKMGTTYGPGDGSTTFNLPNKSGRVSAMCDATGTILTGLTIGPNGNTLGGNGGGEASALNTSNLPPYTPSGGVSTSVASSLTGVPLIVFSTGGSNTPTGGGAEAINGGIAATFSASSSFSGNAQGGTSAVFSNVQPTIVCNYIIRII